MFQNKAKCIFLYFMPGAGGYFLSFCISMSSDIICWGHGEEAPFQTLAEKLQAFSFKDYQKYKNWVDFEKRNCWILKYKFVIDDNKKTLFLGHPDRLFCNYNIDFSLVSHAYNLVIDQTGKDDQVYRNHWHKNKILLEQLARRDRLDTPEEWSDRFHAVLKEPYDRIILDNSFLKISYANMLSDQFRSEMIKIFNFCKLYYNEEILDACVELQKQWLLTVVD